MPYKQAFTRIRWGGRLYQDIWETGFNLCRNIEPYNEGNHYEQALLYANGPAVETAIRALHTSGTVPQNQSAKLDWIKAVPVKTDGTTATANPTPEKMIADGPGGQGASVPAQLAYVVSLRSALTRGPATHGRMFLTLGATGVEQSTGAFTQAFADAAATGMAGLLAGIVAALEEDAQVFGELSNVSPIGAGHANPVTNILCGRVADTQRRRRNALDESYSSAPFVAP